jgi:hypothetical protein
MLSFFACVFHVTPDLSHANANSHEKVACVDHQILICNHRDQQGLDVIAFDFIPSTSLNFNIDFSPTVNEILIYDSDSPPDKIALYIKHNTLIL